MKKKIQLKVPRRKSKQQTPTRITNETVAEHRERILAGGRRFKYPHQYLRHKLVINALLISLVALLVVVGFGWWQLYVARSTGDFMYRVTRALPLPVASVDGENVRYSDYLMRYVPQERWLVKEGRMNLGGKEGQAQTDFIKRQTLDSVERNALAQKIAHEKNISVSEKEVQDVIDDLREMANGTISQEVYNASARDGYGYSPDEFRHILHQSLLTQKVAFTIDTDAKTSKQAVETALAANPTPTLDAVATAFKQANPTKDMEFGESGLVPRDNRDGGRTQMALKLKPGEVSKGFEATTGDGYYFVQLVEQNNRQVSYRYIRIPLTTFDTQFAAVKKEQKIKEYITIPQAQNVTKKEQQ